ncbi:RNA-directed DNA polymerase, eukaryota, reverse transcriptase zinc-binding domain protein, partial [Tanacetum coccineum]
PVWGCDILACFSSLIPWHDDFVVKERLIWLEIEGVPLRPRDNDVFTKICNKWGEVLFLDDTDKCNRLSKRVCIKSSHALLVFATIMVTLNNVTYAIRVRELCSWNPNFVEENSLNEEVDSLDNYEGYENGSKDENEVESVADILLDKSELHSTDKDVLPKQQETEKSAVQQAPLDSDPFGLESLIKQRCGKVSDVNHSVAPDFPPGFSPNNKGNSHTTSSSHKYKAGSSNFQVGFSMIERLEETIKVGLALGLNMEARGLSGGTRLMWIAVYAPQNLSCKISLWSSLANRIANWNGSLVIMGDFNEVRVAEERFGSVFSLFPHATGIVLEKGAPDHRPILLKELEVILIVLMPKTLLRKPRLNGLLKVMKIPVSSKWCTWIFGCLRNARASVLVNGSPTCEFKIQRGLRQGDPLSPFLFILAMEGLHVLTCKAMTMGLFKGVSVGNDSLNISHLIYADDVIFLGIGVSDEEVSNMANVIGCEAAKFPLK